MISVGGLHFAPNAHCQHWRLRHTRPAVPSAAAMSARAIVSGVVFGAPASSIGKTGRPYAFVTIREGAGQAARWWKAFFFDEPIIGEILRFGEGEPIAVVGEFDAEIYSPAGGEARISWRIRVDGVLSARPNAKPKPKAEKPASAVNSGREMAASSWASPTAGALFDDSLSF